MLAPTNGLSRCVPCGGFVGVGVAVTAPVGVAVGLGVAVAVAPLVGVAVGRAVAVAVAPDVAVAVARAVAVAVAPVVAVAVGTGVPLPPGSVPQTRAPLRYSVTCVQSA